MAYLKILYKKCEIRIDTGIFRSQCVDAKEKYFYSPREEYTLKHLCRHMNQSYICPTSNSGIVITGSFRKKYSITVGSNFMLYIFNSKNISENRISTTPVSLQFTISILVIHAFVFPVFKNLTRTSIFLNNNLTWNKNLLRKIFQHHRDLRKVGYSASQNTP